MEVKEGTLVLVKSNLLPTELNPRLASINLGIVKKVSEEGFFWVHTSMGIGLLNGDELFPLCMYCKPFKTAEEALRARLPDVVVHLADMVVDLQRQIKELQNRPSALPYTIPKKIE